MDEKEYDLEALLEEVKREEPAPEPPTPAPRRTPPRRRPPYALAAAGLALLLLILLLPRAGQESEAPVPTGTSAAAQEPAPTPTSTPEPQYRAVDFAAIRALYPAGEPALGMAGETADWGVFCDILENTCAQIAARFGPDDTWDSPTGDGRSQAQYAVARSLQELETQLSYRVLAAAQGVTLDEAERAALTDEALAEAAGGAEQLEAALHAQNLSVESYRWIAESGMLANKCYLTRYGAGGALVSDGEAAAWLTERGYLSAAHILLPTVDPATGEALAPSIVSERRWQAAAITADLRGVDNPTGRMLLFRQLKQTFCQDGGRLAYPDGYTFTLGTMVPAFEEAVQTLGEYEVSDPVESSYGFHVIVRLPLTADSLLYNADGAPIPAREAVAAAGMQEQLTQTARQNPAEALAAAGFTLTPYLIAGE